MPKPTPKRRSESEVQALVNRRRRAKANLRRCAKKYAAACQRRPLESERVQRAWQHLLSAAIVVAEVLS